MEPTDPTVTDEFRLTVILSNNCLIFQTHGEPDMNFLANVMLALALRITQNKNRCDCPKCVGVYQACELIISNITDPSEHTLN